SRSWSMSCSAILTSRSSGKSRMSVRRFLRKTALPAPIIAILIIWWKSSGVLLEAGAGDPLHQLALEEDEDREHRDQRQRRDRHDVGPLGVVLAAQQVEAELDGVHILLGQDHQRQREIVPAPH